MYVVIEKTIHYDDWQLSKETIEVYGPFDDEFQSLNWIEIRQSKVRHTSTKTRYWRIRKVKQKSYKKR